MNCPKCSAAMEKVTVDEIDVDRCTACHGMWFDAREHELLKDVRGAAKVVDVGPKAADASTPHKLMCPVCHTPMIAMAVHGKKGLAYESCKVCYGAFFDAGEFREYAGDGAGWLKRLFGAG